MSPTSWTAVNENGEFKTEYNVYAEEELSEEDLASKSFYLNIYGYNIEASKKQIFLKDCVIKICETSIEVKEGDTDSLKPEVIAYSLTGNTEALILFNVPVKKDTLTGGVYFECDWSDHSIESSYKTFSNKVEYKNEYYPVVQVIFSPPKCSYYKTTTDSDGNKTETREEYLASPYKVEVQSVCSFGDNCFYSN